MKGKQFSSLTIRWGGAIFKAIELTIKFVLRPLIHRIKVEALLFMEAGRVVVYKIDHDHLVHFNDKKKYCLSCSYFIFNIVSNNFWLYQDEGYLLKIKSREADLNHRLKDNSFLPQQSSALPIKLSREN